jgi:hypothetical protein
MPKLALFRVKTAVSIHFITNGISFLGRPIPTNRYKTFRFEPLYFTSVFF